MAGQRARLAAEAASQDADIVRSDDSLRERALSQFTYCDTSINARVGRRVSHLEKRGEVGNPFLLFIVGAVVAADAVRCVSALMSQSLPMRQNAQRACPSRRSLSSSAQPEPPRTAGTGVRLSKRGKPPCDKI